MHLTRVSVSAISEKKHRKPDQPTARADLFRVRLVYSLQRSDQAAGSGNCGEPPSRCWRRLFVYRFDKLDGTVGRLANQTAIKPVLPTSDSRI